MVPTHLRSITSPLAKSAFPAVAILFSTASVAQKPVYDARTGLRMPAEQARYCEFIQQARKEYEDARKVLYDPFTRQNYKEPDPAVFSAKLRAQFGPNLTFTDWVGVVEVSPAGDDVASMDLAFSCSYVPNYSERSFLEGGLTTAGRNDLVHTPPPGALPLRFSDPMIAQVIALPDHKGPGKVSGHIYTDRKTGFVLTGGTFSSVTRAIDASGYVAHFDKVTLVSK